jgi:hypothetical protein
VCLAKYREEDKALEMPMLMTKAEKMADGRIRWQARANTGKKDLEGERFTVSFWQDVLHNFSKVQECCSKGEATPGGLPVPILDIAHYSFRLPAAKRNLARAGYPIKLWIDGTALMAQGYFDETPIGRAAAKAAMTREVGDRRVSIGVWPDWGRVELGEDGHRIYNGGRGRAYLDHLAMTAHPIDPGTVLEVKSMTQKQDAIDVLGPDGAALVDELEAAKTKSAPDGVVVKAEEAEAQPEPEVKAEAAKPAAEEAPASFTRGDMEKFLKNFVKEFLASFKSALDERMGPVEAAIGEIATMKAQIDALAAEETVKVKAAIDSPAGAWYETMIKASVQRREAPVEGKGPAERPPAPDDPFNRMFGGLRKE